MMMPPRLRKLAMAPTQLRARFLKLIERERQRAEAGQAAEIRAKVNSLVDEPPSPGAMLDRLGTSSLAWPWRRAISSTSWVRKRQVPRSANARISRRWAIWVSWSGLFFRIRAASSRV